MGMFGLEYVQDNFFHMVPKITCVIHPENIFSTLPLEYSKSAFIFPRNIGLVNKLGNYHYLFLKGGTWESEIAEINVQQGGLQCHHPSRLVIIWPGKPSGPLGAMKILRQEKNIGKMGQAFSAIA